jgi:hypothetical protein
LKPSIALIREAALPALNVHDNLDKTLLQRRDGLLPGDYFYIIFIS